MARPAEHVTYRLAQYLALERFSNVKHEFLNWHIYAMAGGTPEHAALAAAVMRLLPLPPGGRVYSSDLRIRVAAGLDDLDTYPDASVVCGPAVGDSEDAHAITNPTVLVEVLSPTTEAYDRGPKWERYRTLSSLRAYVLVAHGRRHVEVRARRDAAAAWTTTEAGPGETIALAALGATLAVDALYDAAADGADAALGARPMSRPAAHATSSLADYVALERDSTTRHEFVDGAIYAMTGATLAHGRLVTRLLLMLGQQLRPLCEVLESTVRVRIAAHNAVRYPDVTVVDGPIVRAPDDAEAITNPIVVLEVLSPSTEAVDRGAKHAEYTALATLRAYVLIEPERSQVDVWVRADESAPWQYEVVTSGTVALDAIGCVLALADLYRGAE